MGAWSSGSASRTAPSSSTGTARASTSPCARCANTSTAVRAILHGEDPPAGDKWPTSFRFMGYEARAGPPDLHRRPLPRDAAPGGRGRRRRRPVALRAHLHPRGRGARGDEGPREGGQAVRRVRHRRCGAVGGHGRPGGGAGDHAQGPDPLLLAAVLPRDDRAVRLRARHARRRDARVSDLERLPRSEPPRRQTAAIDRYFDAGATSPCVGPIAKTDFEATLRALSR